MKKIFKKPIKFPVLPKRLSDFICNFAAVVLGIIITFWGSDLIEERKKNNEVRDAILILKDEILLNRASIDKMIQKEAIEQKGARYLLQYKDSLEKASPDSLNKYCNFTFQAQSFILLKDAMEMMKTSSLIPSIRNKGLATQIIKTYNAIESAYTTFEGFTIDKIESMINLTSNPEVKEFLDNNPAYSPGELWKLLFKHKGGVQALRDIAFMHSRPELVYGPILNK